MARRQTETRCLSCKGGISSPFAGMTRIRFKGSPRCRDGRRYLSPLSGPPLDGLDSIRAALRGNEEPLHTACVYRSNNQEGKTGRCHVICCWPQSPERSRLARLPLEGADISTGRLFAAAVRCRRHQIRLSPERHAVDLPRRHLLQADQDRRRRRQGPCPGRHRAAGLCRSALFPGLQAGELREGQGGRPGLHRGTLRQARFDGRRCRRARHLPGQARRPDGEPGRPSCAAWTPRTAAPSSCGAPRAIARSCR